MSSPLRLLVSFRRSAKRGAACVGRIDARIRLGLALPAKVEGGAIVAPDGSLIGLAVTGPRRRALAIPAVTIDRAVATLLVKGYVARGYLGVELQSLRRRGGGPGVIVAEVEPNSPAQEAGFVVGDIITTWGNGICSHDQRRGAATRY